jgi:predicted MFS family arabinose efflux permease
VGSILALKSIAQAVKISRAPFVTLGLTGALWGTMAAMVPALKLQIDATDAEFGISLVGGAVGGVVAMYFGPRVFEALGKYSLPVLTAMMILTFQLPIFAQSTEALFLMMFVLSMSITGVDISANIRLSQLEERHSTHLMNVSHAMYSLGFGCAALGISGLRQLGLGVAEVFPLIGCITGLLALLVWEKHWQAFTAKESDDPPPLRLPWVLILLTSTMLFASFVGENAIETWSAIFMERDLGGMQGAGSLGPAMLGFVMCAARLFGQVIVQRFGETRLLVGSGGLGAIGVLILASSQSQSGALMGIAIGAIGIAAIVPTGSALLGKTVHSTQRALALSRAWMFGMSGFFVGPALMGLISQQWGLRVAFVLVAVLVAVIIPAVLLTQKRRKL